MRNVWIAAVLVFGAAALLYGTTAAPDVGLVDSGELSLAAATGGVAHPPGVPLWLLTGRVFATLPVAGGAARALNLMSAFWMAAAVGALVVAAERLLAFLGSAPGGSRQGDTRNEVAESRARLIAAVGAAVMFAVAYNPWTWSSVAEVYALNTFLAAATWAFAWDAAVRLRSTPASAPAPAAAWRSVTGASIAASLGLANHHATAALAFPVLLVLVALVRPTLYRTRRFWVTTVSAVVGSLALYLYLFVAARHDPALNWGGIDSFELLLRHLRGAQYAQQVGSSPEEMKRVAGDFFLTLGNGGGWIAAALVAYGLFRLAKGSKRDRGTGRTAAVMLIAAIALNLLLSVNYVAGPEDRVAYDLPATLAWFLAAAVGVHALARRDRFGVPVAIVACLAGVAFSVIRNGPLCDLRSDRTARTFVVEALGELPPGAVVLTAEWNLYAPYLYLRHVEGWRPDLRVIDVLMLRRHWYLAYLAREYPELCEATRVPFDRFREQIDRFDRDRPYDREHIQQWYEEIVLAWLAAGRADGGAYVDWGCQDHPQEIGWIRQARTYPEGLLLRSLPADATPGVPDVGPMDAANLARIRARLTDEAVAGDRESLIPRHDPYFRVWRTYASAVEASLIVAATEGPAALQAQIDRVRPWFPDTDFLASRVRARLGG